MTELHYHSKDIYGNPRVCRLVQASVDHPWCLSEEYGPEVRLTKIRGEWKQLSGEVLPKELIRGAGAYIDRNYYESVPLQIKLRWPKLIASSVRQSPGEVMIVCTPGVNLASFRPIFCKYVSQLFREDINVALKVYSYDFTQDFNFRLEVKSKRELSRPIW
ncbi:hypothetical protein ACS5PU_03915 [Pedobacter sp. GSP4]|uniref:hypothetical protein n=1 Tax=Pedobacter sp. GSP4 TaxID=3453716 RepID=UPI003EE896BB